MNFKDFIKSENTQISAAIVFAAVAAGGVVEYANRGMSLIVGLPTAVMHDFNPNNRTEGFVREAQDHIFAKAGCIQFTEDTALQRKAFNVVALCRAAEKHSIFFGPTLRELIESELPNSDKKGNGWFTMPGKGGPDLLTLTILAS